jgi:hypothetical protein
MAVNARTEEFQHIEVFDKPALFTNGRIARDTVPKGWYCYPECQVFFAKKL